MRVFRFFRGCVFYESPIFKATYKKFIKKIKKKKSLFIHAHPYLNLFAELKCISYVIGNSKNSILKKCGAYFGFGIDYLLIEFEF